MVTKFVKERKLKAYQCDRYGYLRTIALMNKLQSLAGSHADILGAGREYCAAHNVAWFLTHMFVDIPDMPRAEENLVYSTWPSVTGPLRSERDFEIRDESGKLRVRAISQWVLIDLATRRPVRINELLPGWTGLPERAWERDFDKPKPFIPTRSSVWSCRFDDIDINQHVNNAVYAVWATESVGFEYRNTHKLRGMDIYFEREINPSTPMIRIELAIDGNISHHKIMTNEVEHAQMVCYWEKLK